MAIAARDFPTKDGVVTADPGEFADAVEFAARGRLDGIWVRPDHPTSEGTSVVDLSLLDRVPSLVEFGIAEDVPAARVASFESIYGLRELRKLSMFAYAKLDLARFPALETLFVRDSKGLSGLDSLASLRMLRIWSLGAEDLSFVTGLPQLDSLWLARPAAKRLRGLGSSLSLRSLELHHAGKLEAIEVLPGSLERLHVEKCPKLVDPGFLRGNTSVTSLYFESPRSLAFVPTMTRLESIAFGNVVDGDLGPLLESRSLTRVHFHPERKTYSHRLDEIRSGIASRGA